MENNTGKKRIQVSYKQIICLCLTGLIGILIIAFSAYIYFDIKKECQRNALQEAEKTAIWAADQVDEYLNSLKQYSSAGVGAEDIAKGTLEQWMEQWLPPLGEEIVVFDRDNQVIYSTAPTLNEACRKFLAQNGDNRIYENRGVSYMAAFSTSDVLGWNYVVFHDLGQEKADFHFPWGWSLLLCFLAIADFVLAVYLFFHPSSISAKDGGQTEELTEQAGDEQELQSVSLRTLKEDKLTFQEMMSQNQDKLLEMFELGLVRGEVSQEEEYQEYVTNLGLRPWKFFATAVAVLNLKWEEENQSNVNEDVICLEIVEKMPEKLKKMAWIPPIYNAGTIFAIFGEDNEDILLQKVTEYYRGVQEFSELVYGYRILMGVSSTHTDHRHIRAAYRESINAMTNTYIEDQENQGAVDENMKDCRFYLASSAASGNDYDASFEKEVQMGIKAISKAQCYKATDEFAHYMVLMNGSPDETMVYVLRYVNTIFSTALETKVDLEALYPDSLRKVYSELLEVLEPSRVRRYIKKNLIDPILEARNELLEKRSYSMMEEIERLIEESRGDITLTECADALGVHPTYIWKILKMEKGKSFSDYLEKYKVNEAKRLLLNTNLTVAEIAAELNYTNAQNFIRFFSKSTGVTPGKFRKLH